MIATYNQLSDDHPVSQLLTPHFEGTLLINNLAQKALISSGGIIDKLLAATIDQSRIYGARGAQSFTFHFDDMYLPRWLARRGVDDAAALPFYPYRDNALMVFDAVKQWCTSYVSIAYADDSKVADDQELQAWLTELTAFEGGRLKGIGQEDGIATRAYLSEVLTTVMFTASAQHAAVNFPQSALMSFAPGMPLAAYTPAPGSDGFQPDTRYVDMMPPYANALEQLNILILLGSVYYTELGQYPEDHFQGDAVNQALQTFQHQLAAAEAKMKERDPEGDYPFLWPSQIPQSINI